MENNVNEMLEEVMENELTTMEDVEFTDMPYETSDDKSGLSTVAKVGLTIFGGIVVVKVAPKLGRFVAKILKIDDKLDQRKKERYIKWLESRGMVISNASPTVAFEEPEIENNKPEVEENLD